MKNMNSKLNRRTARLSQSLPANRNLLSSLQTSARSQKGSALIIASIFMIVATFLIVYAGRVISESSKQARQQETTLAEGENVARSGLVDGINYFRRTKNVATGNPI